MRLEFNHSILLVFILLVLSFEPLLAQVNTEAMRKSGVTKGIVYSGALDASIAQGNTEFIIFDTQIRFDYRKNKYHSFIIGNLSYGKQKGEKFVNKGFLHARLVRTLNPRLVVETFAQNEFDDFLNLKRRQLFGGGLRILALTSGDQSTFHLGIAIMGESEYYIDPAEKDKKLIRSTNYLTGKWLINENINFSMTTYFQPDINSLSDYRILLNSTLNIKLTDIFSFNVKIAYRRDSEPPGDLKKDDLKLTNGISFTL